MSGRLPDTPEIARRRAAARRTALVLAVVVLGVFAAFIWKGVSGA